VEAVRFPTAKLGVGTGLGEGRRGGHGIASAAKIWGVSDQEYLRKADVWPLNPDGEIILGLKIEDKHALSNVEQSLSVPGIAFAEWGPSDMALSLGFPFETGEGSMPAPMRAARARVLAATKAHKIFFLNSVNPKNITQMIDEGVMIGAAGASGAETSEIGRKYSKRPQPW
ncbi:MAG: aldolase/citrate lyase family protein, partial [Bryobacteraceae bacterium]